MATRVYRPAWLRALRKIRHPMRSLRRFGKRQAKRKFGKRTRRPMKVPTGLARRDGWDSIRPGRTIIEWLPAPEVGRGLVLAFEPGRTLLVDFEGSNFRSGIRIEDIRVLA